MKKTLPFLIILLSFFLLTGQSCISSKQEGTAGPVNSGIWLSNDKGELWTQKDLMPTINGVQKLSSLDFNFLIFDPQDIETVYWGAGEAGLHVSYDGMRSWQEVRKIPQTKINDLTIDPRAQNIIYLSIGNRIYKTTDCCHNWRDIYIDIPGVAINSLAVDYANSSRILAGLADGRLLESRDAGTNWSLLLTFKGNIKDILFNPHNSKIVYLGTQNEGLYKSFDGGLTWTENEALKDISDGKNFQYAFFDETREDGIYILTDGGFFRSRDNGWDEYKLLTPEGKVKIAAFAVNPYNPNDVYYATENTFYKSNNGGTTWVTKNLPTTSKPIFLMVHPKDQNIIIMGTEKAEKKK